VPQVSTLHSFLTQLLCKLCSLAMYALYSTAVAVAFSHAAAVLHHVQHGHVAHWCSLVRMPFTLPQAPQVVVGPGEEVVLASFVRRGCVASWDWTGVLLTSLQGLAALARVQVGKAFDAMNMSSSRVLVFVHD
jgi:hypothetical protein